MKRYFFDVAFRSSIQYDYRGRELEKPEKARELAELMALDLECSDEGDWEGAEVRVHDVRGSRCFSVIVRAPELLAA